MNDNDNEESNAMNVMQQPVPNNTTFGLWSELTETK